MLAHNGTEGILRVERHVWGVFVMVSAAAMLLVVLTGYRRGERWAWYAAFYQFAFFLAVAAIEPDWVFRSGDSVMAMKDHLRSGLRQSRPSRFCFRFTGRKRE